MRTVAPSGATAGDRHPTRVLVVGHGALATGFARVIHSILERLARSGGERWEFHHFAPYYRGPEIREPWPIYPNRLGADVYGIEQVSEHVERLRPGIVVLVDDATLFPLHLARIEPLRARLGFRVVVYTPRDDEPVPPLLMADLQGVDRFVAYTETGARAFARALEGDRRRQPGLRFPPIDVIPHGVDPNRFRPLHGRRPAQGELDRRQARRELFGDDRLANGFLVLNANRNQPRKRIDLTLEGFARFARGKPDDVKLYLHMGTETPGANRLADARRLGIEDRLLLSRPGPRHPSVPDEQLNLVYNACDVGVNTACAEGWGLIAFEHAATGAAQVMTGFGVREELWADAGVLLPTVDTRIPDGTVVERNTTPEALADALERLYRDREHLAQRSAAAYRVALDPELHWDAVALRWDRLFQEVDETRHRRAPKGRGERPRRVPIAATG